MGVYQAAEDSESVSELKRDFSILKDGVADNIFVKLEHTSQKGFCIGTNGEILSVSNTNYYVSDPIDVREYHTLQITARSNYAHYLYAFYDRDDNFISGKKVANGESLTIIENEIVTKPNNAKYIRIAMAYNIEPYMSCSYETYNVKNIENYQKKLIAGKNITIDQDTISARGIEDITLKEKYFVNIPFKKEWEEGYINHHGESGMSNYIHTVKIEVNEGDVFYITSDTTGGKQTMRFITAYNQEGKAISKDGGEYLSKYIVPNGIVYIIASISSSTMSLDPKNTLHIERNIEDFVIKKKNINDKLFEKKWCVMGDSFSYGGYSPMNTFDNGKYIGCRKTYPYFIGNRTHINIEDFTLGGRTLAYPSDGSFSNSLTNPNAECYYQNIPIDTDYITIYIGINDSHHASGSSGTDGEDITGVIPIGTVDDTTTATFGGAWNVMLSWLMENRPNTHIGIIVSNGVDNIAYRDITIAIAKKYGIPYIDLNGDERTPAMIRSVNPNVSSRVKDILKQKWAVNPNSNTHPNDNAHEYESWIIEDFLRSL